MRFYFGTPNAINRVADSIPFYGGGEFESPTRSTVPLLSLLIQAPGKFTEMIGSLGMPGDSDLYLEYTVPPPRGQGNPSHTDVMVRSGDDALAIEAKWTEPLSETVEKWLSRGTNRANRDAVLEGWLGLIGDCLKRQFHPDDFLPVNYQMLHRAASAAKTGDNPRLAYFLFTNPSVKQATQPAQVREKLKDFWDRLGQPDKFTFYAVEVKIQATAAYENHLRLKKGAPATSEAVIAALRESAPLFEFEPRSPHPITGGIHP